MRRRQTSEREQLDLFRALPGDLAPRDAQDLMAYPFFSLAKSKRTVPIDFRAGKITIRVEAMPCSGTASTRMEIAPARKSIGTTRFDLASEKNG